MSRSSLTEMGGARPRQTAARQGRAPAEKTRPKKRPLFSSAEAVLVRKDLNSIWRRRGTRTMLMALPPVLVVLLPLTYFTAVSMLPEPADAAIPEVIRKLMLQEDASVGYRQFWMDAFTTLLCPVLFLFVPILCSVVSASCTFVSERESGTLETLLLSSMHAKSIFNAKLVTCSLLSIAISLLSFFAFAIAMSVADIVLSVRYFLNLEWLAILILLMPALAVFSTVFVSLILTRVSGTAESLQTFGYLALPFILLYLLQFAGLFRIGVLLLVILAVLFAVLTIVFYNLSARRFQAELLLAGNGEDRTA